MEDNTNNQSNVFSVIEKPIQKEIEQSYITYSLSVIIGRVIPDVRDGLKPVHRRILWSMWEMGITHDKPTKKCARIVGDVLGKYHPHGDQSVYDALVRMAQEFSLRYPLVIGQGNFGSIDGDPAAAMRYTEAQLSKISSNLLEDIDKETITFGLNFDDSMQEPEVLPTNIPTLLVNGTEGIAVGMTTSIPPHNLREVIDALVYLINHQECSIEDLFQFIKGPDFPTYGTILFADDFYQSYLTGKGKFIIRGKVRFEEDKNSKYVVITELPYQVNKAELVKKIADLVKNDIIQGIIDLRDESDQNGIRVVIKIRKSEKPGVILNKLYRHTQLQKSFYSNMVAISDYKPVTFNLKSLLYEYYVFKKEIVVKRFNFLLKKAKERIHILEGLIIALNNIDEVIALIKKSKDTAEAKSRLIMKFELSEIQAQAILDMRLQRLTSLEVNKLKEEYEKIKREIERIEYILSSQDTINEQVIKELKEMRELYGDERRTQIIHDVEEEDYILDIIPEDVIVITTHQGYIKRVIANNFVSQGRGGKGRRGMSLGEEDEIASIHKCSTTDYICFFSNIGKAYAIKVADLPEGRFYSKGELIHNFIELEDGESIKNIDTVSEFTEDQGILFISKSGIAKRISLHELRNCTRKTGVRYAEIREGDEIIDSIVCKDKDQALIGTMHGKSIKFKVDEVRKTGRSSIGVKGINLSEGDNVVSMVRVDLSKTVLIVSENGYGKKVSFNDFPLQSRGGKGVYIISNLKKAGDIIKMLCVDDEDEILIATTDGNTIKIETNQIKVQNRNTLGLTIVRMNEGQTVSDITLA